MDPFSEEGQTEILRHKMKASPQAPKPAEAEVPEGDESQAATPAPEEPLLNRIKVTHNKAVALNVDTQMITLANGQKVYYEKVSSSSAVKSVYFDLRVIGNIYVGW